ncbi:MAG TPA: dihydrodipicolinate synthase family protein [Ignavibacteriaceae bacterium]|nr:dihydrodipicolinate synthase family protein [Ignavibacteriaceae bacterium]
MRNNVSGIFPPLTTTFIDNELSIDNLLRNIRRYERRDLSGYVLFGSNGESAFLTRDEKISIVENIREHTKKLLIAGTGSDSIKETISLTNEAAEKGADIALIITPSFFKSEMKHHTFINYYTAVAESVMIPVFIYNVPKFTDVNIESETVIKLAEHPNIIGLKDSTENPSRISEIVASVPESFKVLVGTASVLYPGLAAGAVGGILALADIAPDLCLDIYNFFKEKKFDEALEIQNRMIPVNRAVTSKFGVAGLKAAMDLLGYYGGQPRLPLEPLSEAQSIELKIILKHASLID